MKYLLTFLSTRTGVPIKAFTLVEILVVLGLFSSISTLVLGTLFNAQAINSRLQETQAIFDNINLSTQTITRDIRFGSDFYGTTTLPVVSVPLPTIRRSCPQSLGGCNVLIFKPADAVDDRDRVVYYVNNGVLFKEEYPFGSSATISQMTAGDVLIESLIFYVDGAQTSDGSNDENAAFDYIQPRVTLLVSGRTNPGSTTKSPVRFNIQTTISSRGIDNK